MSGLAMNRDCFIVDTGYNLLSPKVIGSEKVRRGVVNKDCCYFHTMHTYWTLFPSSARGDITYGYQTRYRLALVSSTIPPPLIKPYQVK